jgi:2'-5' RNA ligase
VLRTFVAIELPPPARRQVQDRQRHLRQAFDGEGVGDLFRWTHADNLHLTLRFLGDTDAAQRAQIEAALASIAAAAPAFRLAVRKPGAFPSLRKPNIIWLDFGGDLDMLTPLQAQIETAAQAAGFAAEDRAFAPHLTIARAQKNAAPALLARAGELLRAESAAPDALALFPVQHIHLIRSDLHPAGPVYRPLALFALAGAAAQASVDSY